MVCPGLLPPPHMCRLPGSNHNMHFPPPTSHTPHPTSPMQHGDIGIIGPHDLLVCFSKSGATEEIIRLVPFAKVSCLAHMCEGKACL